MSRPSVRAIALMYHDVIADQRWDSSGFPGPGAARYKLPTEHFEDHLQAFAPVRRRTAASSTTMELLATPRSDAPVFLTFDDGGVTAATEIAPRLERFGWRGHFFIPTDYLGRPTFMSPAEVRELHRRGHVVGSHSASHPARISACTRAEMLTEWKTSVAVLSEIVGERVCTASVPEGYYSPVVAETAAEAGIEALFTSEPTNRARHVGGCLVLGRHAIMRDTSPTAAARLAEGRFLPALRQSLLWSAKELVKRVGAEHYLTLRSLLLGVSAADAEAKRPR